MCLPAFTTAWSAQNELVFDANELKTNPQKAPETHAFVGRSRKMPEFS